MRRGEMLSFERKGVHVEAGMDGFAGNENLTLKIVSLCIRVKGILTDLPSDMSGRVF